MAKLVLMRHAKSDRGDPESTDVDRPLNARGARATRRMGDYLRKKGLVPDRILCSTARRARQTLAGLGAGLADCPGAQLDEDLYLASPETLLQAIAEVGTSAETLLVIAHNPGIEELASFLVDRGVVDGAARAAMERGFATAALAVFELDQSDFRDIRFGGVRLVDFVTPKMLAAVDAGGPVA
ncbi:MAG: histidine phosphatase family protein [Myxococcota bacterium]